MQPIVNGLKDEYLDQIEFRSLDANNGEGKLAFQFYRLPGHPSYLVLNEAGDVMWMGVGEKTSDQIKIQMDTLLPK